MVLVYNALTVSPILPYNHSMTLVGELFPARDSACGSPGDLPFSMEVLAPACAGLKRDALGLSHLDVWRTDPARVTRPGLRYHDRLPVPVRVPLNSKSTGEC